MQQRHRTVSFPKGTPVLPERFRGRPVVDSAKCAAGCKLCVDSCPTDAIKKENNALSIDLGRCLFCSQCEENCSCGAIKFSGEYRLAARTQDDLILRGQEMKLAEALG